MTARAPARLARWAGAALCVTVVAPTPAPAAGSEADEAPRARQARSRRAQAAAAAFTAAGAQWPPRGVYLRVFKQEGQLEVWAARDDDTLVRVRTYPVCARSGDPGPKRRRGDGQVPEGLYHIDRYNAWSTFHLSLGINYPNASDRARGGGEALGGDIFIHGDCVTIGCVPLGDDAIEELYVITRAAVGAGQRTVPVHIFPLHMDEAGMARLRAIAAVRRDPGLLDLWEELAAVYRHFARAPRMPVTRIERGTGRYVWAGSAGP
jgi:murein L,D-transpeptidase YafK